MAAGKEIRRLRISHGKKISVARVASLIGVDSERLRKWEYKDIDPYDSSDIQKIETYFGVPLNKLKDLDDFQFSAQGSYRVGTSIRMSNQPLPSERKSDRESALEYENLSLRLNQIETNLNEILSNQVGVIVMIKELMKRQAFYRFGNDQKKLIQEFEEINKIIGGVVK